MQCTHRYEGAEAGLSLTFLYPHFLKCPFRAAAGAEEAGQSLQRCLTDGIDGARAGVNALVCSSSLYFLRFVTF